MRADIEQDPALEIYVECLVIGLIKALQPMLNSTVVAFFALSDEERKQRWMSLGEDDSFPAAESEWPSDDLDDAPYPIGDAWAELSASIRKIQVAEWKHLALDVVTKPEAMIRDVRTSEAFRMVVDLTCHGEKPWSAAEIEVMNIVVNAPICNNLLTVLRDLRRVFH